MTLTILFGLLFILAYTDIREYRIPNFIIFPAVLYGCLLTGFWFQAMAAFLFLAFLTKDGKFLRWAGGDVKLMTMIASFTGWLFIPICILTNLAVKIYRILLNSKMGLPLAPFAGLATVVVTTAVAVLRMVL